MCLVSHQFHPCSDHNPAQIIFTAAFIIIKEKHLLMVDYSIE